MKKVIVFLSFFFFVVAAVKAQGNQINAATTVKVIYSLLGKTYTEAQSILKSNGLKMNEKEKNLEEGLDNYLFARENSEDPEMEPDYAVSCKGNKVVIVRVSYNYELGEEETVLKKDRKEIVKQLTTEGFSGDDGKKKSKMNFFKNKSNGACIYTDLDNASFNLIMGEVKYVELVTAE